MDLIALFETLGSLVLGVTALAEIVDKFWNLDGWLSQARSLVLAVLLGIAGAGFHLGMFADPIVLGAVSWYLGGGAIGLAAGLIANWSFTTPIVLKLLEVIRLRPKQA